MPGTAGGAPTTAYGEYHGPRVLSRKRGRGAITLVREKQPGKTNTRGVSHPEMFTHALARYSNKPTMMEAGPRQCLPPGLHVRGMQDASSATVWSESRESTDDATTEDAVSVVQRSSNPLLLRIRPTAAMVAVGLFSRKRPAESSSEVVLSRECRTPSRKNDGGYAQL